MRIEAKPMSLAAYREFFNENPAHSIRGYSIFLDGRMVACFGIFLGEETIMFSEIKPDLPVPKITIYKQARKMLAHFADIKKPIYAINSCKFENSGRFLQSLGFQFVMGSSQGNIFSYTRHLWN